MKTIQKRKKNREQGEGIEKSDHQKVGVVVSADPQTRTVGKEGMNSCYNSNIEM